MSTGIWFFPVAVGLPVLVLAMLQRGRFKGQRFLKQGHVTGIVGRKGAGKTLFMVHEILRTLGQVQTCGICTEKNLERYYEMHEVKPWGWRKIKRQARVSHRCYVATNLKLELPDKLKPYYIQLEDDVPFYSYMGAWPHNTLHCHDELGVYCPADPAFRLPADARTYLKQCRKWGIEILWSTPHEDDITIGVKRQTDFMGLVGRTPTGVSRVKFYHPTEVARAKNRSVPASARPKPDHTYSYRVSYDLARSYNTFQVMAGSDVQSDDLPYLVE